MLLVHRPLLVAFLAVEMVCRNASVKPKAKAKGRAKGTAHEEKVARNLDAASTAALSDKKQMRGQIL